MDELPCRRKVLQSMRSPSQQQRNIGIKFDYRAQPQSDFPLPFPDRNDDIGTADALTLFLSKPRGETA